MPHDLRLYYSPGACSLAVHVALEASGLAFETQRVAIADGAHRTPAFLAINPRGRVPVLAVDGRPYTEAPALLQLVADLAPTTLVPDAPLERARIRELLAFQSGTVHAAFRQIWRPERFSDDTGTHPAIAAHGRAQLGAAFEEFDATVGDGWMSGDRPSLADLLPLVFYRWARRIGTEPSRFAAWSDNVRRLLDLAPVQRAIAREGLTRDEWLPAPA